MKNYINLGGAIFHVLKKNSGVVISYSELHHKINALLEAREFTVGMSCSPFTRDSVVKICNRLANNKELAYKMGLFKTASNSKLILINHSGLSCTVKA